MPIIEYEKFVINLDTCRYLIDGLNLMFVVALLKQLVIKIICKPKNKQKKLAN